MGSRITQKIIKNTVRNYFFMLGMVLSQLCVAQPYELLIKNGRVIDPKNGIDAKLDVAISNGVIVKVAANISVTQSKKVIDASNLIVAPGFIDIHTHVFVGSKPDVFADGIYSCLQVAK